MSLEEFEIDEKKFVLNNEIGEDETGVAFYDDEDELEKTQEVEVINDEDLFSKTLTNVFGDENE